MVSLSKTFLKCLLVIMCLAWHGGVLTPVESQDYLAKCGETCDGFAWVMCVEECRCVHYKMSDFGICMSADYNGTYLPEINIMQKK
ncbi:hypothetical protein MRX96_059198 [Rhipicephalus microplus]